MSWLLRRFRPEQVRELILVLLIFVALLFFGTQIDNYFSARFFNRIATSAAIVAVIAVGQTLVILTRNIDLSVGSIVGFTAYFVGFQLSNNNDINPLMAVLMAVAVGAALGAVNGLLVSYGRVPAIIVTLGTLALLPFAAAAALRISLSSPPTCRSGFWICRAPIFLAWATLMCGCW